MTSKTVLTSLDMRHGHLEAAIEALITDVTEAITDPTLAPGGYDYLASAVADLTAAADHISAARARVHQARHDALMAGDAR